MVGATKYVYGRGKSDEHTDQHMVTASPGLAAAFPGALSQEDAAELGRVMEKSWRDQFVEQTALAGASSGGVSATTLAGGGGPENVTDGDKEHVYHLIASLPPGAEWTDEQWSAVAQDLMEGMGFTQGGEDEKGARWAAVRHGKSAGGNDHLHILASTVRQDGRPVRLPGNDFKLAQDVRKQIEQRRDFVLPLHERGNRQGRSMPGYTMAEHQRSRERAKTTDQEVPDRVLLQQMVRSAATTSHTEAEFIDTVLDSRDDIELEPARWAPGGQDQVTGYKVRLGEGPWLSASKLAPDLTLQKLRPEWDPHETDATREEALALWRGDQQPAPSAPAPDDVEPHLHEAAEQLRGWNDRLERLDPNDHAAWRAAARDAAGIVSTMSRAPGQIGERFAFVGNTLARQTLMAVDTDDRRQPQLQKGPDPSADLPRAGHGPRPAEQAGRQIQLALRASSPDQNRGWLAVIQQMRRTAEALHAAKRARGERIAAEQMRAGAADVLAETHHRLDHTLPGLPGQDREWDDETRASRRMHDFNSMGRDPMALRPTAEGAPARRTPSPKPGQNLGRGPSRGR